MDAREEMRLTLQEQDQDEFSALLRSPKRCFDSKVRHGQLSAALRCIFEQIKYYEPRIREQIKVEEISKTYGHMLDILLKQVEVVHIVAPTEQDAFRLFETLNDRGLALSAADLIKNKLFSRCDSTDDAIAAWNEMVTSLGDEDVVDFLRYWWMATQGFVRSRMLYKTYQRHIETLSSGEATLLTLELAEAAEHYKHITVPDLNKPQWGPPTAQTMRRLAKYRNKACRSVLLACALSKKQWMPFVAEICESITVRYSIVGEKNTNNLERLYALVCDRLRRKDVELSGVFAAEDMTDVPTDKEFVDKLATMEIETKVAAWRSILGRLVDAKGTGEMDVSNSDNVHIEHILPQNPSDQALNEAGFGTHEEAKPYVSRLGNLTLLASGWNVKASNRPFSDKRALYIKSEIAMTRDLGTRDSWSAAAISDRSRKLASIAATVFREPAVIVAASRPR